MPSVTDAILPARSPDARLRWLTLQDRSSVGGAFDDFDFVTGLCGVQRLACEVLFTAVDGVDQFGVILPFRRLGPFRDSFLPRFCPTSPVLIANNAETPEQTTAIESALSCIASRYHRVGLHLTADISQTVSHRGWTSTPLYTYRFDLTSLGNDVAAGWSAGTRRLYRKNVNSYALTESADATTAVQLCSDSYARAGRPLPIDVEAMSSFAKTPAGDVATRTWLATNRETGKAEAGLVVLQHKKTAFYWIAGSVPGPGMTVLIGHVLQELRESGTTVFDFLGANTPSIAEFKRRFGPVLHEYRRFSVSRSRILNLLLRLRSRLR